MNKGQFPLSKKNIGTLLTMQVATRCYAKFIDHTLDELLRGLGIQLAPKWNIAKKSFSIIIATLFTISTAVSSGFIQSSLMEAIHKMFTISLTMLLVSTIVMTTGVGSYRVFKNLNLPASSLFSCMISGLSSVTGYLIFDNFRLGVKGIGASFFLQGSCFLFSYVMTCLAINKSGDMILKRKPMDWWEIKKDLTSFP